MTDEVTRLTLPLLVVEDLREIGRQVNENSEQKATAAIVHLMNDHICKHEEQYDGGNGRPLVYVGHDDE